MTGSPAASEILETIGNWLEQGAPGADAFEGRVAGNALGIVHRELLLWPQAETRAIARLEAILGITGSFAELEELLCTRLETGSIRFDDRQVLEHLRAVALDRLAIDQPNFRSLLT